MQALVYNGPGDKAWTTKPDPSIVDATDAIVQIDSSTICGTDLHILKGDVPEVRPGTILGVPQDDNGFVATDEYGWVLGVNDVYAAGDMTQFPLKQGGIATQQADAVACARAEPGHAVDHVHHQVEAVEVVEHHHVERRRGRALLLVAAHVEVVVVGAPVGQPVDQPRVAVVGEDHRLVGGEQRVELASDSPCGCSLSGCSASGRRR
jgi:hypothetical protein